MYNLKMSKFGDIINIFKPIGLSPLDSTKIFQEKYPEYKDAKMTYAGRLDPMAEGVLVLLSGKSVHNKNKYLKLDKEYEAEVLFGFETDTYDILGIPSSPKLPKLCLGDYKGAALGIQKLKKEMENLRANAFLPLPPYSSYKIKGKPLFQWAREARLAEIEIPKREMKIYDTNLIDSYEMSADKLKETVFYKISLVNGDFRQEEILNQWQKTFSSAGNKEYQIVKVKIHCSSGTYIRSIANELGKNSGSGAILLNLARLRVGDFKAEDSVRI